MGKSSCCKEYNAIDILKLVMAVLIMVIHSGADKTVISPVLRIAVPLFFIISSYLFFSKNDKLTSVKEKKLLLSKLVKRNLILYLFWASVQFPLLFFMREFYKDGLLDGIWRSLKDVLVGNAFTGAWYIFALVIGIVIVFLLSKKISSVWLIVITIPLYIICCLVTNYYYLIDGNGFVIKISDGYNALTGMCFYTSFPVALFWISIGKVLVDKKPTLKTNVLLIVTIVFVALLSLERFFIIKNSSGITDDCYFMLMLICPVIFLLVSKSKRTFFTNIRIREISTVLYVTHGCSGRVLGYILKLTPLNTTLLIVIKMILSLLVAVIICQLLVYLGEKKNVKLFKCAY